MLALQLWCERHANRSEGGSRRTMTEKMLLESQLGIQARRRPRDFAGTALL